jgi:hypothetical protein
MNMNMHTIILVIFTCCCLGVLFWYLKTENKKDNKLNPPAGKASPKPANIITISAIDMISNPEVANTVPKTQSALEKLVEAFTVHGEEAAVVEIARLYMFGLRPGINPNKLEGGRLCNVIENDDRFSPVAKEHANALYKELKYTDDDVIPGGTDALPVIAQYIGQNGPMDLKHMSALVGASANANANVPRAVATATTATAAPRIHIHTRDDFLIDIGLINIGEQHRLLGALERQHHVPRVQVIIDNNNNMPRYGDSQNVHSSSVQKGVAQKLQFIESHSHNNSHNSHTMDSFRAHVKNSSMSVTEKENIERVLQSLSHAVHSRYNKSEHDIFDSVWNRINASVNQDRRDDMANVFAANIASGIEHDTVVCSTGKVVRMIGSLDGMDAETNAVGMQELRPEWALDAEMATAAAKIRQDVLSTATPAQVSEYEGTSDGANANANGGQLLVDEMKQRLAVKLNADYVDLVPVSMLQLKIEELSLVY